MSISIERIVGLNDTGDVVQAKVLLSDYEKTGKWDDLWYAYVLYDYETEKYRYSLIKENLCEEYKKMDTILLEQIEIMMREKDESRFHELEKEIDVIRKFCQERLKYRLKDECTEEMKKVFDIMEKVVDLNVKDIESRMNSIKKRNIRL